MTSDFGWEHLVAMAAAEEADVSSPAMLLEQLAIRNRLFQIDRDAKIRGLLRGLVGRVRDAQKIYLHHQFCRKIATELGASKLNTQRERCISLLQEELALREAAHRACDWSPETRQFFRLCISAGADTSTLARQFRNGDFQLSASREIVYANRERDHQLAKVSLLTYCGTFWSVSFLLYACPCISLGTAGILVWLLGVPTLCGMLLHADIKRQIAREAIATRINRLLLSPRLVGFQNRT